MSEAYLCVVEGPEGTFLRVAKPNETPEDFPLSFERRAYLVARLSASLQHDVQAAKGRVESRVTVWMEMDAAGS